jgi:hypothetical protein
MRELPVPGAARHDLRPHGPRRRGERPGYQIHVMPGDSMDAQIERLMPLLGLSDADIQRARRRWQRQRHLPLVLLDDAPERRWRR